VTISDVYRFIAEKLSLWIYKCTEEFWESWLLLTGLQYELHWWHTKMVIILMPNIGQHLCVPIYSHMKCKFWVYQDTEAQGAWAVSWNISIKKDYNQIRSRALGIHFWPACLSIYLSGKLLLRNSATLIKIGILDQFEEESDTVVFPKVWHHPYFHHVMGWVPVNAYTVIRKDFVLG